MTDSASLPPAVRDIIALTAAFFLSAGVNLALGRMGLAAAGASNRPLDMAAVFVVLIFLLVPATAGAILGVLASHPVRLAIPLVALSLLVTYFTLGPAGMPHGWKIFDYAVQTAVVAGAAALVAARKRRIFTPRSAR